MLEPAIPRLNAFVSRPEQSQGLLYKHLRFIQYIKGLKGILAQISSSICTRVIENSLVWH